MYFSAHFSIKYNTNNKTRRKKLTGADQLLPIETLLLKRRLIIYVQHLFIILKPADFFFYYQLIVDKSDNSAACPGQRITPVDVLDDMIVSQGNS